MIKERADELVAALRSGKYRQGKRRLRNAEDGFCCLGVACEISHLGHWKKTSVGYDYADATSADRNGTVLPTFVAEHFGIATTAAIWSGAPLKEGFNNFFSLTELNDSDWSFDRIATFIEQNWKRL